MITNNKLAKKIICTVRIVRWDHSDENMTSRGTASRSNSHDELHSIWATATNEPVDTAQCIDRKHFSNLNEMQNLQFQRIEDLHIVAEKLAESDSENRSPRKKNVLTRNSHWCF
jgi:hypothetical protein